MYPFLNILQKLLKLLQKDLILNLYLLLNKLKDLNHNLKDNNNLNNYNLDKLCNKWDNSDLNPWLLLDKLFNNNNNNL